MEVYMHKYLFILLLSILIMASPILGNTSRSHTGGPDGFGYMWIDSDTTGGPDFQWVDATDGTIIGTGDDEYFTVPLDFTFNYYGFDYDTVYVGTNGIIGFGSHLGISSGFNSTIPTSGTPNNYCGIFLDDLNVTSGGIMYRKTIGTTPNRTFVIEWNNIFRYSIYDDPITFEILLYEGSGDIIYQYLDATISSSSSYTNGKSATTGIENDDGTDGLLYQYNGDPVDNLLDDSLAIKFYIGEDNQPPVYNTIPRKNTFDTIPVVETQILDASGLASDSLYYNVGSGWLAVPSDSMNSGTNIYYYHIPAQPRGTIVQYYFASTDASTNSNRSSDPSNAPDSFHTFTILPSSGVTMLFNYSGTQDYTERDYYAYVTALTEAGYSFDTYDRDECNSVYSFYDMMLFSMPTPSSGDSSEVNRLLSWMDSGIPTNKKKLFITSCDLGYQQSGHPNGYPNLELFQNYLFADYLGGGNDGLDDDPTTVTSGKIWGVSGLFSEGDTISVLGRSPDVVNPDNTVPYTRSVFTFGDGAWVTHGDTIQACGLQVEYPNYNAVYLTFNFWEIDSLFRPTLIQQSFQWMAGIKQRNVSIAPKEFSIRSMILSSDNNDGFKIFYTIPTESNIKIDIYGIDGRSFGTLFSGKRESGAYHTDLNKKLSSGIYFIRLKAKTSTNIYTKTAKLIIL